MPQSHQQATQCPSGHRAGPACCPLARLWAEEAGRELMWRAGSCLLTGPPSSLPLQEIGSIIGKVRFGIWGTTSPGLPWT